MFSLSHIQTIVFDLDDTLINTRSALIQARIKILKSVIGLSRYSEICIAISQWERLAWYYKSSDLITILPIIGNEFGKTKKMGIENLKKAIIRYKEFELRDIKILNGVQDLFDTCKEKKIRVGIFGNGNSEHQIKKMKKFDEFKLVLSEKSYYFADGQRDKFKPAPDGLIKLLKEMNSIPSMSLYVGDRVTDVLAAKNAGCHSILITVPSMAIKLPPSQYILNHEKADLTLGNLINLKQYIKGLKL